MPRALKRATKKQPAKKSLTRKSKLQKIDIPVKKGAIQRPDLLADFPISNEGRPPSIPHGSGERIMKSTEPVYRVEIDSGAFRILWEIAESEAKKSWMKYKTTIPEYCDAINRAVEAFRLTYESQGPEDEGKPSRKWANRTLKKATAKARPVAGRAKKSPLANRTITRGSTKKVSKAKRTIKRR